MSWRTRLAAIAAAGGLALVGCDSFMTPNGACDPCAVPDPLRVCCPPPYDAPVDAPIIDAPSDAEPFDAGTD
jgi:hypothetical protein